MGTRNRKKKESQKPVEGRKASKPAKKAKASGGGCSCLLIFFIFGLFLALTLVFGYYNSPIIALPFDGLEDVPLTEFFAVNERLTNGVKIQNLNAPESIAVDGEGYLYGGLQDGRIVKIHPSSEGEVGLGKVETVTNGVIKGAETTDGSSHGRPMGIRFRNGALFVMDAVYGLYKLDLKSKVVTQLVSPSALTPSMKFPNDLDLTADGKFAYFTDSSSVYTMKDVADIGLLDGSCNGRLLRYEFASKKVDVVAQDFCFGNGLQLSSDEKTLIMSETSRSRISIIDVATGKTTKIVPLPMLPDNIRMSKRRTYWVCGANVPSFLGKVSMGLPALRQTVAGLFSRKLMALGTPMMFYTQHSIVVEVSQSGEILQALHDPTGRMIVGASQVTELDDGRLVLGSYLASNAAIVNISM